MTDLMNVAIHEGDEVLVPLHQKDGPVDIVTLERGIIDVINDDEVWIYLVSDNPELSSIYDTDDIVSLELYKSSHPEVFV